MSVEAIKIHGGILQARNAEKKRSGIIHRGKAAPRCLKTYLNGPEHAGPFESWGLCK
jgi:hypothetical protein